MKIYNPEKKKLVRLTIRSKDQKSIYITFTDVMVSDCMFELEKLIKPYSSLIENKWKISFDFREAIGGRNLKSKSFSFYTEKSPKEIEEIIKSKYQ